LNTRRTFLKKSLLAATALSVTPLPSCVTMSTTKAKVPMKSGQVNRALVLWYSQTGHTRRCGEVLAKRLAQNGLIVEFSDIRDFQKENIINFDLLVLGSPVFYYDTPDYVKEFIKLLPGLKGMPVASYVTFGGPEGNQDNANYSILQLLSEKNGVPVAGNSFRSLSSFPLAWSKDKVNEKTWSARHLPDENTFQSVRDYADAILGQIKENQPELFVKTLTLREFSTFFGPEWWTKQLVKNHSIIEDNCVQCGACVEKCPVNAIDLAQYHVDTDACVLCFGCINTCEYRAVHMEYSKETVIGFKQFLEQHNIELYLPGELKKSNRNRF
jgi:ferredoxin/flavodoxin